MSIVSSEIIKRDPQIGGRTYVTERHVDHTGKIFTFEYLTDLDEGNQIEIMLSRIEKIENESINKELDYYESLVLDGIPVLPNHPPNYVTPQTIYGYLFNKFCAEADPVKLLKAAYFTDIFTDEELLSYGFPSETILNIRSQAQKVKDAKALLDQYQSPIG